MRSILVRALVVALAIGGAGGALALPMLLLADGTESPHPLRSFARPARAGAAWHRHPHSTGACTSACSARDPRSRSRTQLSRRPPVRPSPSPPVSSRPHRPERQRPPLRSPRRCPHGRQPRSRSPPPPPRRRPHRADAGPGTDTDPGTRSHANARAGTRADEEHSRRTPSGTRRRVPPPRRPSPRQRSRVMALHSPPSSGGAILHPALCRSTPEAPGG